MSEAGILTVVNTLIGDYWDDKGRKNWLFLQGLLGPFLAGFVALIVGLATTVQWNGVFLVYLVAFPIWAAMFVWLFEPKKAADKGVTIAAAPEAPKAAFPVASLVQVASVTLFCSMLYYVFIINGALIFREVGVTEPQNYAAIIFIPQFFILAGAALFKLLSNRSHAVQLGTFLSLMGLGLAGMGIWTAAFFQGQSQSPPLVHVIDASVGSMQGAFLIAGCVALGGAVLAMLTSVTTRPQAVRA